jgi:AraC family transcriptional regulator of adaptative response / DNA-3-methyladenine glycosylase II
MGPELDADVCYRALASRDARFDGRFFTGVATTGIYCRPVCPARTPQARNCRFFPSAAAAAAAGFRPCRRCRPEAAPGSAAWAGTSAVVERALRLVDEGALDDGGVDALAARVGLGERQLRRLFRDQLGASPLAVAATRRAHFAKKLLDETVLPVTEVAHAAGFRSVRRFNAVMRQTFGAAPRALRRRRSAPTRDAALELRLAYRPPFDWRGLVGFLAPRAIPGVEEVRPSVYRRTVQAAGRAGVIEVRPARGTNQLVLHAPPTLARGLTTLAARARRVFDLDADPARIGEHLAQDPRLAPLLRRRAGVRIPGAWSGFEVAVRAILGQQVSVAAATTLSGRVAERFGTPLPGRAGSELRLLFPAPEVLAEAELEALGLPRARAAAVRALAAAVHRDGLDLDGGLDPDEAVARLRALPGIGPWTAAYVALRALGVPDALPAGDLGLRRALGGAGHPLPAADLALRAERWRPWRGYAALLVWGAPSSFPSSATRTR